MPDISYCCVKCHKSTLNIKVDHLECPLCGANFTKKDGIPVILSDEEDCDVLYRKETADWNVNANFYNREIKSPLFWIVHNAKLETYREFIRQTALYLDLGAGNGFFSSELKNRLQVEKIYALDFSISMDIAAKKLFNLSNVLCASSANIPFPDASFDGVFANGALHHFKVQKDWEKSLSEIDRILKPGGFVFIFDRHDSFLGKKLHHIALFLRKILKSIKNEIATSASDHEPDFSITDLNYFLSRGYSVAKRTFQTNIFLFFMVLICNAIEYTIGFVAAQFARKVMFPLAKATRIFNRSPFAVEQCIVLQKLP